MDCDGDGVKEIVSGWSNGSFSVRRESDGSVIFKDTPAVGSSKTSIASIVCADYRMDGSEELIVCMQSGDVRGFLPAGVDVTAALESGNASGNTGVSSKNAADQQILSDLQTKKLELLNELKLLEKTMKSSKVGATDLIAGALPLNTTLAYTLEPLVQRGCLLLQVDASTDVQLTNIIAIDTGARLLSILILATALKLNNPNLNHLQRVRFFLAVT